MKIGYITELYPEIRCIINKVMEKDIKYVNVRRKIWDWNYITNKLSCKIKGEKSDWDTNYYYSPIISPRVDLVHSFNHVCNIKGNWVVTIEGVEPRTTWTVGGGGIKLENNRLYDFTLHNIELLDKDNCKKILALSRSTKELELLFLSRFEKISGFNIKAISKKIEVVHPPQNVFADEIVIGEKYKAIRNKRINFLFVGHDFFCKGGMELLEVLKSFYDGGENFKLTIVSKLNYGDAYASGSTKNDCDKVKKFIADNDWIEYYDVLPNKTVLDLATKSHVGCLPTLSETYGYSVLEMQSCGCPVVSTDIRSLPEINNNMCGWICHIPHKDNTGGAAELSSLLDKEICKERLKSELRRVFNEIFSNREQLKSKALASIDRIKTYHNPYKYSSTLRKIYARAID